MNLLILGASARAAAASALRAGFEPACGDLFADRDLRVLGPSFRVEAHHYPEALARVAAQAPPGPWLYTGALENHPDLVDRISEDRPLWGNAGRVLRAVRDPRHVADVLRQAGLPCPRVELASVGLPRDGRWLVKPLASAGGRGIHPLGPEPYPAQAAGSVYYQERIDGWAGSAVFLGLGDGAELVGMTRQMTGRPGAEFCYVGSLGPWPLTGPEESRVRELGRVLGEAFGLLGLFGIDLILRDGQPWPVEVNPRYTASVEVLEMALGRRLLADHARLFDPRIPVAPRERPAGPGYFAKAIAFARAAARFPDACSWTPRPDRWRRPVAIADVPDPGTPFLPGQPVLTVFARGPTPELCQARLGRQVARWERRILVAEVGREERERED